MAKDDYGEYDDYTAKKKPLDTKLSANFTLGELLHSATANKHEIDNYPDNSDVLANLKKLCQQILQPLRTYLGTPVGINSGYRCEKLNRAVNKGKNLPSQHCSGEAADIIVDGMTPTQVATVIHKLALPYDQLIIEPSWVHVSVGKRNRREALITPTGRAPYYDYSFT